MTGEPHNPLRQVQMAGAGLVLILALAILGFVWISIGAVAFLRQRLLDIQPELLIGLVCLAPFALFVLRKKSQAHAESRARNDSSASHDELAHISHLAQGMVEKSPLTALAIAALAGVLAVRFPSALTLLLQVLNPQRV